MQNSKKNPVASKIPRISIFLPVAPWGERGNPYPFQAVAQALSGEEMPFDSALLFLWKACSCKCWMFTNAGTARSLELCPSTKEALKQETHCHGMFQASSTRLNQIIAVSTLALALWKGR